MILLNQDYMYERTYIKSSPQYLYDYLLCGLLQCQPRGFIIAWQKSSTTALQQPKLKLSLRLAKPINHIIMGTIKRKNKLCNAKDYKVVDT